MNSFDPAAYQSVQPFAVSLGLGALVWFGQATLAVMLAIAVTMLLYFTARLQGVTRSLTHKDLISILQFVVLSLVVLPILPNQDFGPYDALNPHQIWRMVVLISGLSLAGYAALRMVGNLVFKSGLVIAIGGKTLAKSVLPGLAAIGVGYIAGIGLLT